MYFSKKELSLRCFSLPKGLASRARGKYQEIWLFLPLAIPPPGRRILVCAVLNLTC